MKKYWLIVWASIMLFASVLHARDRNLNIVFIPKSSDQVFWTFMRDGVEKGIRESGDVSLTWRGPSYNDDTDAQIQILKTYTKAGVDAIIIAPTDRVRLAQPLREAAAAGIKIIVVDSGVDGSQYQNFVTTDNYAGGKLAAKQMAELLNGHGSVVVLRTVAGSASTDDRANGFIDYLKANAPKINVVADEYGGGSRGKAQRSAALLLKKPIAFDGVFAVNESATDGMLRALREAGVAKQKRFVGFDSTDFLLEGLKRQEIDGLVVQNPRQMGYLSLKAAVAAAHNEPLKDKTLFTDTTLVTRSNASSPEIQKLLVP